MTSVGVVSKVAASPSCPSLPFLHSPCLRDEYSSSKQHVSRLRSVVDDDGGSGRLSGALDVRKHAGEVPTAAVAETSVYRSYDLPGRSGFPQGKIAPRESAVERAVVLRIDRVEGGPAHF